MKRFLSLLFIICVLSLSLLSLSAFAEEDGSLLRCGDFEDEENVPVWYFGGVTDSAAAYEGALGLQVSNPYGTTGFNATTHVLEYNEEFTLTAGSFYTFSCFVLNPVSESEGEVEAAAYLTGRNVLSVEVSNASASWSPVSVTFMALESGEYTFSLSLFGGDEYVGFFVDSLSLVETTRIPEYAVLEGPDFVYVPDSGYRVYRYNTVVYDSEGLAVNALIRDLSISSDDLPDGIELDEAAGVLRVSSDTPSDCTFSLICSADVGIPLQNTEKSVSTTKNIISSPSFDDGEELWESDDITYEDGFISLYASEKGAYGYYASMRYVNQLVLEEGRMYVFRARVKSTEEFAASDRYIVNQSFASSGIAEINVTGIGGGEYYEVFSAFTVAGTGIYELSINFFAPTERPVYVEFVSLSPEDAAPSSITIHAPGNIQRTETDISLPCYGVLRDQMGNSIENLSVSIAPEGKGVSVSSGEITVSPDARTGDYILTASYGDLTQTLTVTVSDDAIGDGGFELKEANEWWTASDGASFSIFDIGDNRYGYVTSDDSSCLVINNSYMTLCGNRYYVYSADPGIGRGSVTAFIADVYTGEYIPLVSFDPLLEVKETFLAETTVTGRLVLYVSSPDTVSLALDNIAIVPAELAVSDVTISGDKNNLTGSYYYINNMTTDPDADASSFRWYISASEDGDMEEIPGELGSSLEILPYMDGKYIYFEVTPFCSVTNISGESVLSAPFEAVYTPDEADEPTTPSAIAPVKLKDGAANPFSDCVGHWAEDDIAALYASGVISGRSESIFAPEDNITRAEFTAIIVRALSLAPGDSKTGFSDVSESMWYAPYISAATSVFLVSGMGDGSFAPDSEITREQMAVIIDRAMTALGMEYPADSKLSYYDYYLISPWANKSVAALTYLGIFGGGEGNLFNPQKSATRAEAAAVVCRMLREIRF